MSTDPEWRDRFATVPPISSSTVPTQPEQANDQYRAFSTITVAKGPQQKLRLILKTGIEEAFDYSYNSRMSIDGGRITLRYTTGEIVTIEGRNLNLKQGEHPPFFRSLVDHMVSSVCEIDPLEAEAEVLDPNAAIVTHIGIEEDRHPRG